MIKNEQYKCIIRICFIALLFIMEMLLYGYVWINYYSSYMEIQYAGLGHVMMVAIYGVMLLVFTVIFECWQIGYLKNFNMIYAQTLTAICANFIIYLQITLLIKYLASFIPLIIMTFAQVGIIAAWSPAAILLYKKIYPPHKVIVIYAKKCEEILIDKFIQREDCFCVAGLIDTAYGMDKVLAELGKYDGAVICDIPMEERVQIQKFCFDNNIRTYMIPDISDILMRGSKEIRLLDTPLLLSKNTDMSIEQKWIKRFFDIVISLLLLIFFSPLMIAIAFAIKLDDGGPVFFRQNRCTLDGKIFSIWKFRSMIVNAERDGKVIPAVDNDPRITRVGRIIRKIRMDELPQLFNILSGDMSVVGPRPERVEHVELYKKEIPEFKYREKVKAGLTGFAQIYGKYNTSAYDKLKLDLIYIQNYSILLDIEIIFRTIAILFEKESTEGFRETESIKIKRNINIEKK